MLDQQVADWTQAFDAAMASSENTDLEPLWNDVCAAIEANPRHAGLRRLRIRMAASFYEHVREHEDLVALHGMEPSDREVWLDLALIQHRWAYQLVPGSDEDLQQEADADADAPVDSSAQTQLENEARGWIAQIIRQNQADGDFCAKVLAGWSDAGIYAPWLRLTLVLEIAAAHPDDDRFSRELALAWLDLGNQLPEAYDPDSGQLPMGFMVDLQGGLWDPFMQERALDEFAALLQRLPNDVDLLSRRARLLESRCDLPLAAAAYVAAESAARSASQQTDEVDEKAALESTADELGERSRLCTAGRAAIVQAMLTSMDDAVAQFQQGFPVREDASERSRELAREFAEDWDRTMKQTAAELTENVDSLRTTLEGLTADAAALEAMEAQAAQIAAGIVGSVQVTPIGATPVEPTAFEEDWSTTLAPVNDAFRDAGWRQLGWVDWPEFRPVFGHQVVSSVWLSTDGGAVAFASSARGMTLVDVESEFSDGRLFATSTSRGRNFLAAGTDLDSLLIEPNLGIADCVALHSARVGLALARSPQSTLVRCHDIGQAIQQQERMRQQKTRFRIEHGITESESLGIPHDFPEIFAPMLRQKVAESMAGLRQAMPG
ncbi:MAG: hypothetical protein SF172_10195 [Burkholderiales bacterium]|nr:hypothetical protein [Burkholderiales bacterium]